MSPPTTIVQKASHGYGRLLSPFAAWSRECPLGRFFDALDSDEEDAMDALLSAPLRAVGRESRRNRRKARVET